jgi:hypothetical protein
MAWLEALIAGFSYFHVAPNPEGRDDARTCGSSTPRRPSSSTSRARTGASARRPEGLGRRLDRHEIHATLYSMENGRLNLYKYQAKRPAGDGVVRVGSARSLASSRTASG